MAAYVSVKYKYMMIHLLNADLDIICIDTHGSRFIGVYKGFKLPKGSTKITHFRSILETLTTLAKTDKRLTVGGDFNIDLFTRSSNLNDLDNWSVNAGLQQIVTSQTRRRIVNTGTGTRIEESAIDHVYTNDDAFQLTQIPSVSDHDILLIEKPCAAKT